MSLSNAEHQRKFREKQRLLRKSQIDILLEIKEEIVLLRKSLTNSYVRAPPDGFPDKEESTKEENNLSLTPLRIIRSIDQEFEEIWGFFPRRVQKGQARKAYRTARKKAPLDMIVAAIKRYAVEMQVTEPRFILHPATWLNGESWLNEEHKPNGHDRDAVSERSKPTGPPPPLVQRVE